MRLVHPKWILLAAAAVTTSLWAAERTGVLLTDENQEVDGKELTQREKADWKKIKKEQDDVMATLISGNKRHVKHMVHGKDPRVMIVSCADSHIPPEEVFRVKPGDLFVNRAYGNVVDKVILASLEYGAQNLKIPVLVVMGHTNCTALKEAMDEHDKPRLDDQWRSLNSKALYERLEPGVAEVEKSQELSAAQTGKQLTGDDLLDAVVRNNILHTMHDIRQQSPILWDLEQKDLLKIVGCIYHKNTGKVEWIKE